MRKSKIKIQKLKSGLIIFCCLSVFSCDSVIDNNPVNEINSLPVLKFFASKENLNNMYNNRFSDLEIPVRISYNDELHDAAMEASGAGSRYFPKYSFTVEMNKGTIINQNVFSVSAQVHDKTMMKSVITTYMYQAAGFPVFDTEPVFATMNNENLGLYAFIERIEPEFFIRRNINVYELYQVQFDAKFTFSRMNNLRENIDKEIPDNHNYENLEEMIAAIDKVNPENIFPDLEKFINVKEYLMYHAVTSFRHDPDAFTNNFFLYKETPSSPFRIIPWDFDKTFDINGSVGLYGDNDLIRKLFQNDSCRAIYKNNMNNILNSMFTEEKLFPMIDELSAKIAPFYMFDPYLSHNNFEKEVQFLKDFITERRKYLMGELERFN